MIGNRFRPFPRLRARPVTLVLGLLAVLGATSCGGRGPIRIGLMSTFEDPLGRPLRFGAQLAVQEINAAGGINGRQIELVERDDRAIDDSAVAAASDLAQSDVVAIIGGAFSGPTLAAAAVVNDPANPVLQITPSGSSPTISSAGDWTFRVCPSDLAHAAALARFVRQTLHLERGAVLYMNNGYGRGFRDAFEQEFVKLGGNVTSSDPYLPDAVASAGPFLDRIAKNGQAQFLIAASYEVDGSSLLRMARAKKITVPFLGGDGLEGLEHEGAVGEGTYQTAAYLANLETSLNRTFIERYRTAFPREPLPNQTAVATYDAVQILAVLLKDVGTNRLALRNALAQVGRERPPYDGVTGRVAFDSVGDVPEKRVLIAQARGGVARAVEGAQ